MTDRDGRHGGHEQGCEDESWEARGYTCTPRERSLYVLRPLVRCSPYMFRSFFVPGYGYIMSCILDRHASQYCLPWRTRGAIIEAFEPNQTAISELSDVS